MTKSKQIVVEGERFYFRASFDIDDFIGDGIWWLQIYDHSRNLIYDEPFASNQSLGGERSIRKYAREVIKREVSNTGGIAL